MDGRSSPTRPERSGSRRAIGTWLRYPRVIIAPSYLVSQYHRPSQVQTAPRRHADAITTVAEDLLSPAQTTDRPLARAGRQSRRPDGVVPYRYTNENSSDYLKAYAILKNCFSFQSSH